jgi:hypothetical protein
MSAEEQTRVYKVFMWMGTRIRPDNDGEKSYFGTIYQVQQLNLNKSLSAVP